MKINIVFLIYLLTIFGSAFLIINLKREYFDSNWNYFSALEIFILNVSQFIKILKSRKNEKNNI
jgi:hypothetical protein